MGILKGSDKLDPPLPFLIGNNDRESINNQKKKESGDEQPVQSDFRPGVAQWKDDADR